MQLTPEHAALRGTLNRFIDKEIDPHVDEWEREEIFPAQVMLQILSKFMGIFPQPA